MIISRRESRHADACNHFGVHILGEMEKGVWNHFAAQNHHQHTSPMPVPLDVERVVPKGISRCGSEDGDKFQAVVKYVHFSLLMVPR